MNSQHHESDLDRLARKHASAKLGWYFHACIYILVNLLLIGLASLSGRHWAAFPALGWGLGLAIHGFVVLLTTSGYPLRERMVQRERERLAQRDPW